MKKDNMLHLNPENQHFGGCWSLLCGNKGMVRMMISVLIAGEDAGKRARLASPLISQGYYIVESESGEGSIDLLARRRQSMALALLDVEMADISNVDFIANIRRLGLNMPIIALSNHEEDERLRRAVKAGADDFLIYPVSPARLVVSVGNLLQKNMLRDNMRRFLPQEENPPPVSKWSSKNAAQRRLLEQAKQEAENDYGILLICGERGTRREDLARAIHEESRLLHHSAEGDERDPFPFVFRSCCVGEDGMTTLPASSVIAAKCTSAAGGTLCFSNIDMLDKAGQANFLQFIEDQQAAGHILQKNEAKDEKNNQSFRLMVTACANLEDLVEEGSFSSGLYRKLSPHTLHALPLRERREDISDMANYMLARLISETGNTKVNGISGSAVALLSQYDWPGNFEEMEVSIFRAMMLCEGRLLAARDFPRIQEVALGMEPERSDGGGECASAQIFYDASGQHIKPLTEIEREAILEAMKRYRGKISEVARRLKIGRSTLYRKLEEYGLYPEKEE